MSSWDYVALDAGDAPRAPLRAPWRPARLAGLLALALLSTGGWLARSFFEGRVGKAEVHEERNPSWLLEDGDEDALELAAAEDGEELLGRKKGPGLLQLVGSDEQCEDSALWPPSVEVPIGRSEMLRQSKVLYEYRQNGQGHLIYRDVNGTSEAWRTGCQVCFEKDHKLKNGKYRACRDGKELKLCTAHARDAGVNTKVRNPCRDCPPGQETQASYRDENGKAAQLCAKHAKLAGCHHLRNPCRDCPEDKKREANYRDEKGHPNVLCAKHARLAGSYHTTNPCRECPPGQEKQAHFNDRKGNPARLCAEHARLAGTHHTLNPCRDCDPANARQGHYPDEGGTPRVLCSTHAKLAGTHPSWPRKKALARKASLQNAPNEQPADQES
eukprot:g28974.t1